MRYEVECYDGLYGDLWCVRDTARGDLLLPHNYSPAEADYLARTLNGLCREVPRAPRPTLAVVHRSGLAVLHGGAA